MAWYLSVLTLLSPPPYHLVRHTTVFVYRSPPPPCLASIPHPNPFACLPNPLLPPSKLSLDALSRTAYMATRSSPPRDFDSCLIHVAPSFPPVLVLDFLAPRYWPMLFRLLSDNNIYIYKISIRNFLLFTVNFYDSPLLEFQSPSQLSNRPSKFIRHDRNHVKQ